MVFRGVSFLLLTKQERLVVGSECHFVRVNFALFHFVKKFKDFVLQLAGAARLKQPPVDDLDLPDWLQLLLYVLKQLLREVHQVFRVLGVHWESGAEDLVP